jgi:hypothetical protein
MRPTVVALTAPGIAVATVVVVVVVAADATGSGLHRCEDIPLAQESPTPDYCSRIHIDLNESRASP